MSQAAREALWAREKAERPPVPVRAAIIGDVPIQRVTALPGLKLSEVHACPRCGRLTGGWKNPAGSYVQARHRHPVTRKWCREFRPPAGPRAADTSR